MIDNSILLLKYFISISCIFLHHLAFSFLDMSFQCLGSWAGDNGETYMSLLDTQLPQLDEDPRPRYRCAVSNICLIFIL